MISEFSWQYIHEYYSCVYRIMLLNLIKLTRLFKPWLDVFVGLNCKIAIWITILPNSADKYKNGLEIVFSGLESLKLIFTKKKFVSLVLIFCNEQILYSQNRSLTAGILSIISKTIHCISKEESISEIKLNDSTAQHGQGISLKYWEDSI